MAGLKITTYLLDGQPAGLRTMQLSNAIVLGTFFPRPALKDFLRRPEAGRPGVYVLFSAMPEADDPAGERAYIGEGERVGPRLQTHEVHKDFWSQAAVFTSKDDTLSKTQTQFLEASLIAEAKLAARATLDNGTVPALPKVSEADRAEIETFLDHVRMLLGVAGIQILRPRVGLAETPTGQEFVFRVKGAEATMVRTTTGYVVLKGSTAVAELTPGARRSPRAARERLVEVGILTADGPGLLQFTKDHEFESSSGAAMVICGHDASGPKSWKLPDGRTLEQVEESETADGS